MTAEKLRIIERAEDAVRAMGFRVCRVRHHDLGTAGRPLATALARLEIGRDELPRALEPEIQRAPRARAARDRLSARHHRSPGLSDGQPERRCSPPCRLSLAHSRVRSGDRRDVSRGASRVPRAVARRHRLDQLRARAPPLRRRAASAASARISGLHRARPSLEEPLQASRRRRSDRPSTRIAGAGDLVRDRRRGRADRRVSHSIFSAPRPPTSSMAVWATALLAAARSSGSPDRAR